MQSRGPEGVASPSMKGGFLMPKYSRAQRPLNLQLIEAKLIICSIDSNLALVSGNRAGSW